MKKKKKLIIKVNKGNLSRDSAGTYGNFLTGAKQPDTYGGIREFALRQSGPWA